MFIVDAHLDLAYNALEYGRDLRLTVQQVRERESGRVVGDGPITTTLPSLLEAGVGLIVASIFVAPYNKNRAHERVVYRNADEAHRWGMKQLDVYHRWADELDYVRLVTDKVALDEVVASHEADKSPLLGIVPMMEGAEPIRVPQEAELWFERGLRVIAPAWDDTRYAAGAWREGSGRGFTRAGFQLMDIMADLGFALDVTHLNEQSVFEALDHYGGQLLASHSNARHFVPMERHLSDTQIRRLAEREAVIGVVLYNRFITPSYYEGLPKSQVPLAQLIDHIDHMCQLVGKANHVGIGSDFDGGFGADKVPAGINSTLDLPNIATALQERGYNPTDITNIMGQNWLTLLRHTLP